MPPRKRARGAAGALSVAAGSNTPAVATSYDAMTKLQKDCVSVVNSIYDLRHATPQSVYSEPQGLLVPTAAGVFEWPILWGGTFKDIAQRAFQQPEKILHMSAKLAHAVNLLDAPDEAEFCQQYCKLDVAWFYRFFWKSNSQYTIGLRGAIAAK